MQSAIVTCQNNSFHLFQRHSATFNSSHSTYSHLCSIHLQIIFQAEKYRKRGERGPLLLVNIKLLQPAVIMHKWLKCCKINTKSKYITLNATSIYSCKCVSWQWKASDRRHQSIKIPLPTVNFWEIYNSLNIS